jgi:single-strand DNA-binding protein
MSDINHVVLVGRLTRDAELKYTATGQAVCKFSIAVNRRRKMGEQWVDEANFFDIVVWGKQGEALNQYLVKGKLIGVDGELRQDRWEQDGQNRSKVEVVANNLQLLGGGLGQPSGGAAYTERRPEGFQEHTFSARPAYPAPHTNETPNSHNDGFPDDIPF